MKKIHLLIITIFIIVVLVIGTNVFAENQVYPGVNRAKQVGANLSSSVTELIKDNPNNGKMFGSGNSAVASVMGEKITREYLIYRVRYYEACGSQKPVDDAWNAIKVNVYNKKFAEEHNIMPTNEDILAYTAEQKEIAESSNESYAILRSIIDAMGLTEQQYWEEFKPKYESSLILIKENVTNYCEQNNIPAVDPNSIDCKIIKQAVFDELSK